MKKRLAIVTTHPIQYNAPWFKLLAKSNSIDLKVFYTWEQSQAGTKYDPGFGKQIQWDIPLLDGYEYTFVKNTSVQPGTHHFKGIINPTLIEEIKSYDPDVLLVFGWAFVSHLKCIRYFHKKVPILFRGDSTILRKQSSLKSVLRSIFLKWVYKHVDHALYVGTQNKLYFQKYGLKLHQLIFAPHAIDNNRFASPDYETEATIWKKEIGIEDHELTVLYAGKLEPIKNPYFIISLAKTVTDLSIKFVFVGNGPLEEELKSLTQNNKQFIFINFQNQSKMPVVYRLGDIFTLTSKSETWGLGVNEAMACGRAIMVSETVGCAVDLVQNTNGYIFKENDIASSSNFIRKIASDKSQVTVMGGESKKIIQDYSFENIAYAIEKFVTGL